MSSPLISRALGSSESKISPPKNLLIVGMQGSGKGTQGANLVREFNYRKLDFGSVLRAEVDKGTENGRVIDAHQKKGILVPRPIVIEVVNAFIQKALREHVRILLDGYPRSIEQMQDLAVMLGDKETQTVVHLVISDKTAAAAIAKRAKEENRPDDADPKVVQRRIETFKEITMPMINAYDKRGRALHVNGETGIDFATATSHEIEQSKQKVYARIVRALSQRA